MPANTDGYFCFTVLKQPSTDADVGTALYASWMGSALRYFFAMRSTWMGSAWPCCTSRCFDFLVSRKVSFSWSSLRHIHSHTRPLHTPPEGPANSPRVNQSC